MTQKNRQDQLFTGDVEFDGDVTFNGAVNFLAPQLSIAVPGPLPAPGLVVAWGVPPVLADSGNAAQAGTVLGVVLNSTRVVVLGEVAAPHGQPAGTPLFLASSGTVSPTPPMVGFSQQIGTAKNPSTIVVAPMPPIVLA